VNQPAPATDSDERRRPWQRRSMRIGLALGAAVVLYLAFEIGRFSAGYSILAALHEHDVLRGQIAALRGNNRALQAHVVELQTLNAGHAHAEQVVTRTIAQLQAQIARQQEKLAFYRGVVAQGAPPVGLRVGEVLLSAGKRPLHFHVDISLLRADRPDGEVSGALSFTVEGQGPGETTLGNRTLTGKPTDLKYRFRYYQEFKEVIVLPPGFRPLRLTVTVRSSRTNIAPLVQSYPWSAVSVP
jgi:hypothetical protein